MVVDGTLVRFYNAHETSAVEDFAIALVCGEAEFKVRLPLSPRYSRPVQESALNTRRCTRA